MKRFVEGEDRKQGVLLPEYLDDDVSEDNPVRAIDLFVNELDLPALGFEGVVPEATSRPACHPATMLKILGLRLRHQIQSSQRLKRETARNVEMMWLTGRPTPDFQNDRTFARTTAQRSASSFGSSSRSAAVSTCSPRDRCDRRQSVQCR